MAKHNPDDDCRVILLQREKKLGLACYEYAWVNPAEMDAYGADCWRVDFKAPWNDGKLLMSRKRRTILRSFIATPRPNG